MRHGRKLERGYERLDPDERLRLLIAAKTRYDTEDAARIWRSCPRTTARICDPAFSDGCERAFDLALATIAELSVIAAKLDVVDAAEDAGRSFFIVAADEAEFAAFEITGNAQPTISRAVRRQRGCLRRFHRRIRETLLEQGAAVAHAFDAICRYELDLDPAQLIGAAAAPAVPLFEQFMAIDPLAEAVAAFRAELSNVWRRGTARSGPASAGERL